MRQLVRLGGGRLVTLDYLERLKAIREQILKLETEYRAISLQHNREVQRIVDTYPIGEEPSYWEDAMLGELDLRQTLVEELRIDPETRSASRRLRPNRKASK